jgi:hypothetical protein
VGPLDALVAQGATLHYAGSVRRLLSSYAGSSIRLRGNGAGSPEADIPFLANGDNDLTAAAAAAAAAGGTAAFGKVWYDQTETLDATQASEANQMVFSTSVEAKGGFGDGTADAGVWFDLNLGTIPVPSFLLFVVNAGLSASARILIGTSVTNTNRICRLSGQAMGQNWGVLLSGTAGEVAQGKHSLGFLVNDAASQNLLDGTSILTGDADNSQLDMSGGRIGAASSITTNWLNNAGNSLSEVIVFGSDPTGLTGWADFIAAQKTYFGVL